MCIKTISISTLTKQNSISTKNNYNTYIWRHFTVKGKFFFFFSIIFEVHSWLRWMYVKFILTIILIIMIYERCIPLNKNLDTDILSWLKTDITYHLKNSLNLIFLYVFRISVFLAYFENRWNLKYSPLASMIFIHNVLHRMLLLLEVEQDSKEAYKKLQCQQKIYISRK